MNQEELREFSPETEPDTAPAVEPVAQDDPVPEAASVDVGEAQEEETLVKVIDVRFKSGGKAYYFDPGELDISAGIDVIVETSRGAEYGSCTAGCHSISSAASVSPLRPVIRIATQQDKDTLAQYRAKEADAVRICEEKIAKHGLDMKLISAEYAFDGSKILFLFTSDGRVDFRDLVKDLASVFRTRIELRQIGVRDEAKLLGGLGICGRPFCCKQFLDDFQPVSIKMAKTQSLSLNPTKISGTCGRLMCCLKYEQEAYEYLHSEAPKADSLVDTPEGRGTIDEIILLRRQAKVRILDHPDTIKVVSWDDLAVLRSGKAKKDDPDPHSYPATVFEKKEAEVVPAAEESMTIRERYSDSTRRNAAQEAGAEPGREAAAAGRPDSGAKRTNRNRGSSGGKNAAPARTDGAAHTETGSEKSFASPKSSGKHRSGGNRGSRGAGNRQNGAAHDTEAATDERRYTEKVEKTGKIGKSGKGKKYTRRNSQPRTERPNKEGGSE